MSRLQKMANSMNQCSQSLQQGNSSQASDMLGQMAGELNALQNQLDELETLEGAMDEIAQAKASMNCEHCGGGG
jgi:endonuclease IV